jgi:hypothetical protein
MPETPASGAAALGVRQQEDMNRRAELVNLGFECLVDAGSVIKKIAP